jgi:arsenical pump membrane protein
VEGLLSGFAGCTSAVSLAIFFVTSYLMIRRPHGISLGLAAGAGAAASLLLGTVTLSDAAASLTEAWDAALAFVGVAAMSAALDAIGFLRWMALKIAELAGGSGLKLYLYVSLLAASLSAALPNGSAVLMLTPMALELADQLKMDDDDRLAYLFSAGFIAAASAILTAGGHMGAGPFKLSPVGQLAFKVPVAAATAVSSLALILLLFRGRIPRSYSMELLDAERQPMAPPLLRVCMAVLAAVGVGSILASLSRAPASAATCSGALLLLAAYAASLRPRSTPSWWRGLGGLAKRVDWDVAPFMLGTLLVSQGLRRAGALDLLARLLAGAQSMLSASPAFIAAACARAASGWPMVVSLLPALWQAASCVGLKVQQLAILMLPMLLNVAEGGVGPRVLPFGSLAILMWLEAMRRRGVTVRLKDYLKVGSVLSVFDVAEASLILWLELSPLNLA